MRFAYLSMEVMRKSNEKIHDSLTRSPGAFKETIQGLRNLITLKRNYPFKILTNFTVTKINYKDIYDYLRMLMSLPIGIDGIVFNILMYTGNAKRFFKQLAVSCTEISKEIIKTVDKVEKTNLTNGIPFVFSSMPYCLMLGYEKYMGVWEKPLTDRGKSIKVLRRSANITKQDNCKACKCYSYCVGIDTFYAEKIGWSELKPIK